MMIFSFLIFTFLLLLLLTTKFLYTTTLNKNFTVYHKPVNHLFSVFNMALWLKLRVIYYANNWIYTTNHKRIAVNYYWFVIFAGICGMVLATIIRLEMAYPGVGILAGDSLQYLSVVTAHAVIMVFFMIMPLLFGAYGNFLLPTQLGVHDVAFPRLNSAAFWFLPAGLLMLVQLVCLDRRYQRMNCYNIREIQTILKSKYTPNTTDATDIRFSLNDTTIGLRYQLNGLDFLDNSVLTFYKNNLITDYSRSSTYQLLNSPLAEFAPVKNFMEKTSLLYTTLTNGQSTLVAESPSIFIAIKPLFSHFTSVVETIALSIISPTWSNLSSLGNGNLYDKATNVKFKLLTLNPFNEIMPVSSALVGLPSTITLDFTKTLARLFKFDNLELIQVSSLNLIWSQSTTFNVDSIADQTQFLFQEKLDDYRALRMFNPVFKYDFKVGNYLPDDLKKLNRHLFTTIKDVTTGVRKSSWFTSDDFSSLLKSSVAIHQLNFSNLQAPKSTLTSLNSDLDGTFTPNQYYSVGANPTSSFYNMFTLLTNPHVLNTRWIASNALEQKFYKMFATGSMQQRIYANWRQLKFTREAWRCKLLAARHQNTLYKRYLNEDSVVWAVERNAKDVLPGWAMITPFSARTRFTAIGKVDIGLMGVFLVLNSSIVSSANFLVTYRYLSTLNNRKMRDARSFFTEGVMVASWMMIAANPMLAIGILMLLSDRHWQTSFFDYSGGGDTVLFQHMFWFFGHPEVYVIMIPGFGFNNTILSFYLRKRVSARASLLYSMYTIAFLGFFVWGHHMYMVGLAHTTRMLFSTLTVMISVPAATKLMHWCVTLVNSSFGMELPMFFQLLFIFFFVSGGISGMAVAHTGMDILFHDSFYVIGHFHVMLAGAAMFAAFGAFYFYFPAIFGVKYSRIYGYLHALYYLIGQLMTVIPMFWLGYAAMPRRVLDYPAALGGWHAIVSAGHMLSVAGMMAFFIMIFDSLRQGRAATRNSFGVVRFNTRLNFYIYEGARTWFLQRKTWHNARFNRHNSIKLNKLNYVNHEYLESTLYSYVLVQPKS